MDTPPERQQLRLWPTPLGIYQWSQASSANEVLVRVLSAMRATDPGRAPGQAASPFYASRDDLLQRIELPEWQALLRFIGEGIRDCAADANGGWCEPGQNAPGLRIAIEGIWFQMSNRGAHHDIHTHGNCSWSGVYCLQVDGETERAAHPVFGALNGITRFYGPHFNQLGGAHMDMGSAYLQQPHIDLAPRPGQLLVFPSWLAHQAMPYEGSRARVIVSFNASVHAAQGSNQRHAYARG
ncbi:MAG: TIGR02466 family protein [Betaproteobacteria bacterium]